MRRLIIITNNGGKENYLPGVAFDKHNYLDFFHLPEGGYWNNDEIRLYENNCSETVLSSYVLSLRTNGQLDYVVMVFCGHGYTNELGMQMFELSPGYDISKQRICQIMQYTRCLMIADSCRRIVPLAEGGRMPQTRIFSQSHAHDDYKNACRRIYNEKFLSVQVGSFSLGNSASFNQAAGEDNNGGLYSCELLKKAKDEIIRKKNECRAAYYEPIISFSYIHSLARESVMAKTNNQQVPDYATLRGNQPPFVVVP